jgi:hypothetical protein
MGAIPLGIYFQGLHKAAIYLHLIKISMTPEEKAKELFLRYLRIDNTKEWLNSHKAKQCALIAVDEILNINSVDKDFSLSHYWLDVKYEIEHL